MNLFEQRLDKYYGYAFKIAGALGEDLMHHVIIENKLIERCDKVNENALDRYVYLALEREYHSKKSKFFRLYIKPERNVQDFDDTPTKGYDTIKLHTFLLQLENEGYSMEVRVFKECYLLGSSEYEFSKRSNTHRDSIRKICKFIKNEIVKRYDIELD